MATAQDRAELRRIASRDHPRPAAGGGSGEGGEFKLGRRGLWLPEQKKGG